MEKTLLKKEIIADLNYRIQQEEFSSRLYKQMSLWFGNNGYAHLSQLYTKYATEEMNHASWAEGFLLNHGIMPELKPLQSPYAKYDSCMDILEETLKHELDITKQCETLASTALKAGSYTLYSLAIKYCAEQIEEVGKAIDIIDHAMLTKDLLVLDNYIKKYL